MRLLRDKRIWRGIGISILCVAVMQALLAWLLSKGYLSGEKVELWLTVIVLIGVCVGGMSAINGSEKRFLRGLMVSLGFLLCQWTFALITEGEIKPGDEIVWYTSAVMLGTIIAAALAPHKRKRSRKGIQRHSKWKQRRRIEK